MEVKTVGINSIKPYENNPRINDGAVEATANSIKEFGWQQPIVVDKDGVIIVGHTRLRAAKQLGLSQVPVVYADNLTDAQVKAYRLADNKTGELADWDFDLLDVELDDLDLDFDMSDFGFYDDGSDDEEELENQQNQEHVEGTLSGTFLIPPFSVINLASKQVMDRKRGWIDKIQDFGQARAESESYTNKGFNDGTYGITMKTGVSILNPVISEVICKWFLPAGKNKVFDCFSGDTVFGFVSSYLGNSFTGIELRQEQVDFNQKRVDEFGLDAHYICDDGRNVGNHIPAESQDLLFSCPPYFDLEVYSDKENDASNQETYDDFIKILEQAFTNALSA